jgi:hypothetical protein
LAASAQTRQPIPSHFSRDVKKFKAKLKWSKPVPISNIFQNSSRRNFREREMEDYAKQQYGTEIGIREIII